MRRILLLITDLQVGGTPTVVRELAVRLSPLAHVHVACLGQWGPVADQIQAAGVGVTSLNATCAYDLRIVPRLVRLCRRERIDIILSFLIHANAVAGIAAMRLPSVRLIQSIQTTQAHPAWHWRLQRLIHPAAERIVVPTESVAQVAMRRCGIARSRIVVVPNAVEPRELADLDVVSADVRPVPVGFIGRLDPIKRVPDLLGATKLLGDLIHLHVFGDGPERHGLEARVRSLGIETRVTFHGAVARPQDALKRIALLVLPSEAEGFGLVLIEAMAAGIPVVATDAPGIRDVVRDGTTGLLVPVGAPGELAMAVRREIEWPELRKGIIENARADVGARFTWAAVLPKYEALMHSVMRSGCSRR